MTRAAWPHGRAVATLAALATLTALAGCRRKDESDPSAATALLAPAHVPVDHLAPGELLEGPEQAFGINLPRNVHVDQAFAQVVFASGTDTTVHSVVGYLRSRLQGGEIKEGETAATFDGVRSTGDPKRELRIRIAKAPPEVKLEIRDVTPPPPPDLPDEAARWKHVGLGPDGRLVDRTHLD